MRFRGLLQRLGRSAVAGYVVAVVVPIAATLLVSWGHLPAFIFEHLMILAVVAVALPWGLGASVVAAAVAVAADNILLRQPIGEPAITTFRDAVDLALFAAVALIVSTLVTKARAERRHAQQAAERERLAREDRDRLIATVSHDLATPLAVIQGTVQSAQRMNGANIDVPRLLGRLDTAAARVKTLIRTLADARAIDANELALQLSDVDLRALVRPLAMMLDQLSERHPVTLAIPDAPLVVHGDAERLQRVVENLLNNAIKYSPEGGAVEVSLSKDDRYAVLRVRDYGIGVSPDALPHVFERSYRAPEAVRMTPGLGLGLNIAAQIVARHQGTIDLRPASPCGTVATLRLPLAPAAA